MMWSSAAVAHLLQGLVVLCIHTCSSADLGCDKWILELLLLFYQLSLVLSLTFDLWHQQGVFIQRTHWMFSLFLTSSVNPGDGFMGKSQ